MIAHDPRGSPEKTPALPEAVVRQLRDAIQARWGAVTPSDVEATTLTLAATLERAAAEARERSLHPEALVLAIKAIEEQVGVAQSVLDHAERRALRAWLVTACIHAYFRAR